MNMLPLGSKVFSDVLHRVNRIAIGAQRFRLASPATSEPKMPDLLDVVTLTLGGAAVLVAFFLWAELLSTSHLRPK